MSVILRSDGRECVVTASSTRRALSILPVGAISVVLVLRSTWLSEAASSVLMLAPLPDQIGLDALPDAVDLAHVVRVQRMRVRMRTR